MGGGSSVIRRSPAQKSNAEFTSSLRSNFADAQAAAHHEHSKQPNGHSSRPLPYSSWTTRQRDTIFVPSIDFENSGLAEDRPQYEVTIKLFFLPNKPASDRCAQSREAINLVLKELHISSIDLLIVSYPGIAFDADDEEEQPDAEAPNSEDALRADAHAESIEAMIETWKCLEQFHDEGVIGRLGVSEFGTQRLSRFLKKARIRPSVNQINVRDCCVVPKPLIVYAKQEKIELLTHSDCTNILPRETMVELLGHGEGGAGVLGGNAEGSLQGDAEPQWVIKYTAVVKDRGVIENKGYFAAVEIQDSRC